MARDYQAIVESLMLKASDKSVTEAESQALMDKAMKLMAEKGITAILRENAGTEGIINRLIPFSNPYSVVKRRLYTSIATVFRCSCILMGGSIHVFGYRSDLDKAEDLYNYLLQFGYSKLQEAMATRDPFATNAKSFTVQFWNGFMYRVTVRLIEMNKEATAEAESSNPGTAMVLVSRKDQVEKAMHVEYPRTRKTTYRAKGNDGYWSGQDAGNQAGLSNHAAVKGQGAISG